MMMSDIAMDSATSRLSTGGQTPNHSSALSHETVLSACPHSAAHTEDISPFSNGLFLSEDCAAAETTATGDAATSVTSTMAGSVHHLPTAFIVSTTSSSAAAAAAPMGAVVVDATTRNTYNINNSNGSRSGDALTSTTTTTALTNAMGFGSASGAATRRDGCLNGSTSTTSLPTFEAVDADDEANAMGNGHSDIASTAAATRRFSNSSDAVCVLHAAVAAVSDAQPNQTLPPLPADAKNGKRADGEAVTAEKTCVSPLMRGSMTEPEGTSLATPIPSDDLAISDSIAMTPAAPTHPRDSVVVVSDGGDALRGGGDHPMSATPLRVHWCCAAHWRAVRRMERGVQPSPITCGGQDVYCTSAYVKRERKCSHGSGAERGTARVRLHESNAPVMPSSDEMNVVEVRTLPPSVSIPTAALRTGTQRSATTEHYTSADADAAVDGGRADLLPVCEFCDAVVQPCADLDVSCEKTTPNVLVGCGRLRRVRGRAGGVVSPPPASSASRRPSLRVRSGSAPCRRSLLTSSSAVSTILNGGGGAAHIKTISGSNMTSASYPMPLSSSNSSFVSERVESVGVSELNLSFTSELRDRAMLAVADMF